MVDAPSRIRPKLMLALSGGGTRGYTHAGVLQAFEEANIPINGIAGTSAGGMIGGLYAAGYSADEIAKEMRHITSFRGIIQTIAPVFGRSERLRDRLNFDHRFRANLNTYIDPQLTFAELRMPFAVNAVCLTHYEEVILDSGSVADAIRATISVPGVFNAVEVGECRYVDGGVLNNVPTNVARALGGDLVIAVDVGDGHLEPSERETGASYVGLKTAKDLLDTVNLLTSRSTQQHLALSPPDLMIRPKLPPRGFPLADFRQINAIIEAGYVAGKAAIPEIRALLTGATESAAQTA